MSGARVYKLHPRPAQEAGTPGGTNWVYRDTEKQKDTEEGSNRVSREGASRASFLDFIAYACGESRRFAERRKANGRGWQSSTFYFVRLCRGRVEFEGMDINGFHNAVPWQATDFDEDEILTAVAEWAKVKIKAGDNPIISAVLLAQEKPAFRDETFRHFKNFTLFLNIAYHLQRIQGDADIYLPVHQLAAHLSVTARVVSQYRFMAKSYGFLKETAKHTKKKATRFRVKLDAFSKAGGQ